MKCLIVCPDNESLGRPPRRGAWIEIEDDLWMAANMMSPPAQGGVD